MQTDPNSLVFGIMEFGVFRVNRILPHFLHHPHSAIFVQCNRIASLFQILIKRLDLLDFLSHTFQEKKNWIFFSNNYPPKREEWKRISRKRYLCEVWLFSSDPVYFLHWTIYFAST
jgi:hypothetical protein